MTNHYHNPVSRLAHTVATASTYAVLAVSLLTPVALGWLDGAPSRSIVTTTPALGALIRARPPRYTKEHRTALDAFIKRLQNDAR